MVAAYLDALAPVLSQVVAPAAGQVDRHGGFPRAAVDALGRAGLLGLVSAREVGGGG
jgi:isovaleryl-CoA dehydrogenase